MDEITEKARGESWDYPEYLRRLCEVEWEARHGRKLERLLKGAKLPEGKTLATLDETKLSQELRRTLTGASKNSHRSFEELSSNSSTEVSWRDARTSLLSDYRDEERPII